MKMEQNSAKLYCKLFVVYSLKVVKNIKFFFLII